MKQTILRKLMLIAVLLTSVNAFAHDFDVDGIYYNILSETDKTVEVTYKGNSSTSYIEYSGSKIIPEKLVYNGDTYSVTSISKSAFSGCNSLTSVTIGNSVTSIGDAAFDGCYGLTSVTIPNSVTSTGYSAFNSCYCMTSVNISDLEAWCKIDFSNYYSNPVSYAKNLYLNGELLTNIEIPNSITEIKQFAFQGCTGLTSVTIPNSVTSIGYSAFRDCSGLTSVTIGNSVTSIGEYAFSGCSGLTSVTIPNSVTSIGYSAFCDCSGLTSVTIGNSVTSIGEYAFSGCSGLTSVTIPNSVTSIGYSAFCDCSGLTSVTIGNSVTSIGEYAFSGCSGLTSVTIPNSVTSIGGGAFSYCSGLTSVTIPNSVTSIEDYAFLGCSSLTEIISKRATPPTTYSNTFYNFPTTATLYVPIGSKEAYANAEGWNVFTNIVEMEFIEETTITIMDASNQGSVSFNYEEGEAFEFTVSPVTGYIVNTVLVNGDICEAENGTYNIESVSGETIISVSYEIDPETGVNTLSSNNLKVYGYNNTLTVLGAKNGGNISVFDMNGKLITSQKAFGENDIMSLDNDGLYIVKVDNKSFKVIL